MVDRAKKKGRMIDARVFLESYAYGSRNAQKIARWARERGHAVVVLDATKKTPVQLNDVPIVVDDLERAYKKAVAELKRRDVPAYIKRGGSLGTRIWRSIRGKKKQQQQQQQQQQLSSAG